MLGSPTARDEVAGHAGGQRLAPYEQRDPATAGRADVYAVHVSVDRFAAQITGAGSSDSRFVTAAIIAPWPSPESW